MEEKNGRTFKEIIDRIECKLDKIAEEISEINKAITKNEVEHGMFEKKIFELNEKKSLALQSFAWLTAILSIILSILNILKIMRGGL